MVWEGFCGLVGLMWFVRVSVVCAGLCLSLIHSCGRLRIGRCCCRCNPYTLYNNYRRLLRSHAYHVNTLHDQTRLQFSHWRTAHVLFGVPVSPACHAGTCAAMQRVQKQPGGVCERRANARRAQCAGRRAQVRRAHLRGPIVLPGALASVACGFDRQHGEGCVEGSSAEGCGGRAGAWRVLGVLQRVLHRCCRGTGRTA